MPTRNRILVVVTAVTMLTVLVLPVTRTYGATSWYRVATGGFKVPGDMMASVMAEYHSDLYIGTANYGDGCRVWKRAEDSWLEVSSEGFGKGRDNISVQSAAVYGDRLIAGTVNNESGAEVWSYNGTTWSQINTAGFGQDNREAASMAVYNSKLYVGTDNQTSGGCQVWCYDGASWTKVSEDGSGIGTSPGAVSMAVFESQLYVGTRTGEGAGCEIWRYNGTDWSKVNVSGFGDDENLSAESMTVFGSKLYVGTGKWVDGGSDGCEVWAFDGSSWEQVNNDGFGAVTNRVVSSMAVYNQRLFAGVESALPNGCEVWSYAGASWTRESDPGFAEDAENDSVSSMRVWNEELYAGTFNTDDGCEVWTTLQPPPSTTFYFAEGTCRPNFDPYLCIQNPGDEDAAVTLTYMKGDGTTETDSLTVAKGSRATVCPRDKLGTGDDPAHDFSTRVQCTNGQSIIAERPMYFNYQGYTQANWTGGHDVIGATSPSTTFYFAEGTCRPNFDPYLCIQNPGEEDASVSITYMKGDGTTETDSLTVAKGSRATVCPRDKLGTGDDPAHDFSTRVQCTNGQSIIAERPMYFNYQGYTQANWTGGHDVIGATSPSTTFYFAEGTCRPNFDPYLCIQNPGEADAAVTLTYMKGDGTTETDSLTVAKGSRATVCPRDKLGTGDDPAHDFSTRVQCTNGQSIIAERPMYFNYQGYTQANWTGGHDVIGATSPSTPVYFAEGTCRPNFDPYLCIQNPGETDAAVTLTYMKGDGTTETDSLTVAKGSRATVCPRDKLGTGDDPAHDFSTKVQCTNGQSIIAERPMYFKYNGAWTGGHDVVGYQ
ncbi:MAG: hypothetical protein V1748_03950 [Actinomycetota bacterium]